MQKARHPPAILRPRRGQAGSSGGETGKDAVAVDLDVYRGGGVGTAVSQSPAKNGQRHSAGH